MIKEEHIKAAAAIVDNLTQKGTTMSHKVAVDNVEPIIGKSTFYTVKNGEVTPITEDLPSNVIFILNCIKVTQDDKEIVLGKEQDGKRFVPSFELSKSETEFIINYFAEATEDQPAIKLRGTVDLETRTISITGEGFETAEVEVVEFAQQDAPEATE
ncbi:hypothetical protein OBP_083 [Pseudomonas phage OBP]|uniref:hypothetical protein n=1 Tax=Pseudomonas phage OBP TaxID=1124849 RepID=UPI000240D431|nr:hypothetical protein OBP_083 [Pseudomonas phage OBP]AEV89520.1 hypothetical protein OBP_083 [Pseudomonas phage OBP]